MTANVAMKLQKQWESNFFYFQNHLEKGTANEYIFNVFLRRTEKLQAQAREILGMLDKKKRDKVPWKGFANIDIPASRKKEAKEAILSGEWVVNHVAELVDLDYKITVNSNPETGTITATATMLWKGEKNAGYSMSGFGSDWLKAMGSLCFKHFVLAKGDWSGYSVENEEDFF